jgi:hypothetical protein
LPPLRQRRRRADRPPDRQEQPAGAADIYACRKTFTVQVGSIFKDNHYSLGLWLQTIQLICGSKKSILTRQDSVHPPFSCNDALVYVPGVDVPRLRKTYPRMLLTISRMTLTIS